VAKKVNKPVPDTNILISVFVFPSGLVREIMENVFSKSLSIYISTPILEEYSRVLEQKFKWKKRDIMENIRFLAGVFNIIEPSKKVSVIKKDPADDRVIECALEAGADVIVSGDKHLLELKNYRGIRIIKPSELIKII